jgi:2-aminoadipate transaminase
VQIAKDSEVSLPAQIREQITNLIANGDLASGLRLPPVRALARQLDVNQMTVAKAYKDLAGGGFLEGRRGGGTFVRAPNGATKRTRRAEDDDPDRPLLSERLFELARAPGVIAFTGNFPKLDDDCIAEFRACISSVLEGDLASCFQYDPPRGRPELRLRAAEFLQEQGVAVPADDVIVTAGAQQAIDLIVRSHVPHGAPVIVERPAYYGTINALRGVGARIFEVPLQADGMDLDSLEHHLSRHRPRLICTNPTFQNPTGVTTSLEKRHAILALVRRYGAAILEDDHCPELRFRGDPIPPIRALAEPDDAVFYARGFGKVFLPGIRLGLLVAPARMRKLLLAAKASADLHCNAVLQEALARYLARRRYPIWLETIRRTYAARQRQLCDALHAGMPEGTAISVPHGGLSLWLTVPEGADVAELYYRSVRRGVAFVAGEVFYATRAEPRTLRVSFGQNSPDELLEGVNRLCSVVKDLLAPRGAPGMIVS